ncbi:MBL fold metallo-hydrolase [Cellulomonas fimi]|uniref:MBL fold metallo-hydrolase n=1 Tax=Cellulomonas fimi TaxID=1708 RepID=A0A7Y0M0D4_CELFI|nr:MBL fold metallo-hydrolase [Cellulomonas fimi]NMR20137.1 MBL fold metallo-hydrolase [Cellulomonas fimi]
MEVLTAVAPVFGTNCYVVVADDDVSCVVVDVGAGIAERLHDVVVGRGLRLVAVLATHGHVDHTWGAGELVDAFGVALHVHAADAYRLADPFGSLGLGRPGHDAHGPLAQALMAAGLRPDEYRTPVRVETFADTTASGVALELDGALFAGAPLTAVHAPGHTQGASLFLAAGVPSPTSVLPPGTPAEAVTGVTGTAFTGDVLFAGSIGRTDLPGGHGPTMERTLAERVVTLAPSLLVLPGHGPASSVGLELDRNPFLAG